MSKITKTIIALSIVFIILPIIYTVYKDRTFFDPIGKTRVEFQKDNVTVVKDKFRFSKIGCHEIGLQSNGDAFDFYRIRGFDQTINLKGDYNISYYKNGKLLEHKKLTFETGINTISMKGANKASYISLDTIGIPFKGYDSVDVVLTFNNLDDRLIDTKQKFSLYTKWDYSDGCTPEAKQRAFINANLIEKPERNETLRPLYDALLYKDTKAVENFFNKTKLPYDVKMNGNRTALHYAVYFDDENTTAFLLKKNSSMIDEKDFANETAISYSIGNYNIKPLIELLKYKPDLKTIEYSIGKIIRLNMIHDAYTDTSKRVLAVKKQKHSLEETLEILLRAGVNPNVVYPSLGGYTNITPLDYALDKQSRRDYALTKNYSDDDTENDHSQIIELLRKYGAKTFAELKEANQTTTNKSKGE